MCKIESAKLFFESKKNIQIIIQTTFDCNLRCKHCYEGDCNYPKGIMSEEVLERVIRLVMESYPEITFIWFGGEPLLAGLDFFKKVVHYQSLYKKEYHKIRNAVQTNAILINEDYARFFAENQFQVSVSLDAQYNDYLRTQTEDTLRGVELCKKAGIQLGFLSVIHSQNYTNMYDMYMYFKERGWKAKFNRIYGEGSARKNREFLIPSEEYNKAFIGFFEKWLFDSSAQKHSCFEVVLSALYSTGNRECSYSGCLFSWMTFSPTGEAYNCPRFMGSEYTFGNIMNVETFNELFYSPKYGELAKKSTARRKKCASECKLFRFCRGGCNAQCLYAAGLELPAPDQCSFAKTVFSYVAKRLFELSTSDKLEHVSDYMQKYVSDNKERIADVYHCLFEDEG